MKVLMFGWEFPPHISGGLGTACYGLVKGLLKSDAEVTFVVPRMFGGENTKSFRIIGASGYPLGNSPALVQLLEDKFTFIGISSPIIPYMSPEDFYQYSMEQKHTQEFATDPHSSGFELSGKYGRDLMGEVWKYALIGAQIASNEKFDIIHAHDWLSFPAGIMAKQITGKPLIVHVHATEYDRSGDQVNKQVYDIEKQGMLAADKIISVSDFTRQIIINKYQIPAEKVVTIHNAVEPISGPENMRSAGRNMKEKIVSYLGRITFQKGPEYFIEAAAKVLNKDKGFRFVMAGSGDMLNRMIRKVAELRISSHFHFTGFLRADEVNRMFSLSDLYIMPSVSEPFGISPLESISAGVPVIISKQSGVQEVLKHAVSIDFWDTDAMANAIHALTRYKGLPQLLVREGRREIEKLKWETQAQKVNVLYHQTINDLS